MLDMYLKATRQLYAGTREKRIAVAVLDSIDLPISVLSEETPFLDVTLTVASWSNANAIHKWFVENVQNGKDDGRDYYVDRSTLEDLLGLCNRVVHLGDVSLLRPHRGFRSGSTKVDANYWLQVTTTINQLQTVLENRKLDGNYLFYYRASW